MARSGPSKGRLSFNASLTGVPAHEQLKRLSDLSHELAAFDQDTVDTKSLEKVKVQLINGSLLLGKDKGVKAYTCCCLADLLRLYAPDCPYEDKELKDIFQFFIRQLKYLTGPSCPNYAQYFYLIESLSTVKSATLMPTLPGAEHIMTEMTKQCFDLAKPDMPKNVISHIADILVQIIDEAPALPSGLVDLLLAQFLPKNLKANPTSLSLAVEVCNQTAEKLQRYIAEYFTEVLLVSPEDEDEDMESEPETSTKKGKKGKGAAGTASKADDAELILTHDLIKSIARTCPQLLANVIPLVEEELTSEDMGIRILASRTLGEMFSDKPLEKAGSLPVLLASSIQTSRADLAKKYPNTWRAWLGRSRDKAPQVRIVILECARDILPMHHELGRDIYEIWKGRFIDPDDKIRAAACAAFSTVDYESSLHAFEKDTLVSLASRIQDRKPTVQKEALNSLGRMYNNAFGEISNGDPSAIDRFCWIPAEILKCSLLADRHLQASTERVLHDYILPLPPRPEEESFFVDRLLLVMHYLDVPGRKALLRAARLFEKRPLVYETYMDICETYNGGNVENVDDADEEARKLAVACRVLAASFPEPIKAEADLHKFAKLNDHRTMKLIRTLMDPETEGRTIAKNVEEVLKRIEKASSSILETFSIIIRRAGFLLINKSTIPHLIERVTRAAELRDQQLEQDQDGDDDVEKVNQQNDAQVQSFGELAEHILQTIIKNCPMLLKAHIPQLCQILLEDKHDLIVNLALHGLSSVTLSYPEAFIRDSNVLDKAFDLAMDRSSVQAKYASTFLAAVPDNQVQCEDLVKNLTDALPASSGERLISHLSGLKRLAKYAIEAFETRAREITTFATGQLKKPTLYSTPSKNSNASMDIDINPFNGSFDEWCADEDFLPEHQACLLGLKVLTNRVYALADKEDATEIEGVSQIFKLLGFILTKAGKPSTFKTGPGLAGRLRLESAISLLKLGTQEAYYKLFMEYFEHFAWTMQDPAFQVRSGLVHKFIRYASQGKIKNPKMHTALFLTAHDPDVENRLMPQKYIAERLKIAKPETRLHHFELLLVRLLHLLAHHPDFSTDIEDLANFARYIEFFLDCVGTRDNVSLLYYLALKCKTVRDSKSAEFDENLYTLSELAQYVIKSRANLMGWTLDKYAGQIRMPSDIFKPLPNSEVAMEIRKKAYISTEDIEQIGAVGKPVDAPKKPRPAKKANTTGTASGKPKTHARKASTSSNGDHAQANGSSTTKCKARPEARPKSAGAKTNGNGNTSMNRKRKKGLKEWEDDTEDEEEDAEEDDEDEENEEDEDEHDEAESDVTSNSKVTAKEAEAKSRPSNLRQRPARTSNVVPSNPAKPESNGASKPVSKGKAKAGNHEDDDEEEGKMSNNSAPPADSSKENVHEHDDDDEAQTANGVSPKRRRTAKAASDKSSKKSATKDEEESEKQASPGKRRTRSRGGA